MIVNIIFVIITKTGTPCHHRYNQFMKKDVYLLKVRYIISILYREVIWNRDLAV